jgi:hypothetical protein
VVIDCTTLPEHLIESELFGYEPGSFTSASRDGRPGKFELADGGTVILDEVADLPPAFQPKLLRILNDQMVARIGARKPKAIDVRVIACTNRDLGALVDKGEFRLDLYHRLKGAVLFLPPLRERMKQFDELFDLFARLYGHGRTVEIDQQAKAMLYDYRWPGNIRELEKTVQYMLVRSGGGALTVEHVPKEIVYDEMDVKSRTLVETLMLHEKLLIANALQANNHHVGKTAVKLGLTDWGLRKKIRKLGVEMPHTVHQRMPKRMGRGNKAHIDIISVAPVAVTAGGTVEIVLRVANLGTNSWIETTDTVSRMRGKYHLSATWVLPERLGSFQISKGTLQNKSLVHLNVIPLPRPIDPDETIEISYSINAPKITGHYAVFFTMNQGGVGGFLENPQGSIQYSFRNAPKVLIDVT